MIRALLLDLDGTLIHSEPVAAQALAEVFVKYGGSLPSDQARAVIGRTWHSALDLIDQKIGLPLPREQLLDEVLDLYRSRLLTHVAEVPGAAQAIHTLSQHFQIAVVSGSFREEIEAALNGLRVRDRISLVLGAEDYPQSKPSPDGYLKALNHFGVRPSEALIFEDSEAGMAAGLAAGSPVVAITHCSSVKRGSIWLSRVQSTIQDWSQVTPDWVRSFSE